MAIITLYSKLTYSYKLYSLFTLYHLFDNLYAMITATTMNYANPLLPFYFFKFLFHIMSNLLHQLLT